jgi:2-haloalkanoic acid dehalogenase type II
MRETLSFDCYGTLIDWETGIWDALQPLLMQSPPGEGIPARAGALAAFARAESAQQAESPTMLYPLVLERVHAELAAEFGLRTTPQMNRAFGGSVGNWPAFADAADSLRRLKTQYRLVILSNVNRAGFAASQRKLGVHFDAVYTAEDIGSYKPDDRNFEYMIEHLGPDLGVSIRDVTHVAQSLFHDHVPAGRHGLKSVWIDRQGLSSGGEWGATAPVEEQPEVDAIYPSMKAFADAGVSA